MIMNIFTFNYLLNLDSVLHLLEDKFFSPNGSTANVKEQNAYIFFKDLLEEIECEKKVMCTHTSDTQHMSTLVIF